jgi:hypothetical protein
MDKSSTPQKNVVKMERAEAVETKEVNFSRVDKLHVREDDLFDIGC